MSVKELVEMTMHDNDMSQEEAVQSVARTLDMTPQQVWDECVQEELDELGDDIEPPDDV